jgi:hypothetical protein
MDVNRLLEITFILIVVYLVVTNARDFGGVITNLGSTYVSGVKALQGR